MPIAGPRKLLPRRWEKARESNGIAGIPVYKKKWKIPDAASRALKGRQSPVVRCELVIARRDSPTLFDLIEEY
jgi:hypothetical protein